MRVTQYDPISLRCPRCEENQMETTYTVYRIVDFRMETSTFISCVQCAKKELSEIANSAFPEYWENILPALVKYLHSIQTPFIKVDHEAVHNALLNKIGISKSDHNNVALLGIYLAVSMIKADGKIVASEIDVARELGAIILPDFDEYVFQEVVTQAAALPEVQVVARLLSNLLPYEGKKAVFKYLTQISLADNDSHMTEHVLLIEVAENLNLEPEDFELQF